MRADTLPLVFKALGCEALPRGAHVRLRITGMDLLTLDLHATLATRLDLALAGDGAAGTAAGQGDEAGEANDDDDDAAAAAPLSLAIDLGDAEPLAPAAPAVLPPDPAGAAA